MERLYCTVNELLDDLEVEGVRNQSEARILDKIQAASQWIDLNLGRFIPVSETRRYDGNGTRELYLDPVLGITELVVDGVNAAAGDFLLYPRNRLWQYGPYIRIMIDPSVSVSGIYNFLRANDSVAVTGRFGMYEQTVVSGATVASQTDNASSLVVDNAGGISVGAVLLIEDEQELVNAVGTATDSLAKLTADVDAEDEIMALSVASGLHVGEVIKVDFEQMKILDISGNNVLVTRGWNRTKRASHTDLSSVYVYRTFAVARGVNGTVAAAHTSKAIFVYVAPGDIHWLCKQMAALMLKKADSAFAGRIGNAETGETFYINEFPKSVIDQIRVNYFVPLL